VQQQYHANSNKTECSVIKFASSGPEANQKQIMRKIWDQQIAG
jgi:hypothetical protein